MRRTSAATSRPAAVRSARPGADLPTARSRRGRRRTSRRRPPRTCARAPTPVRTADLPVAEAVGRLPDLDLARPPQRHAVDPQPVLDPRPGLDGDRIGRDDPEGEPGRRHPLEVVRIGEEGEDLASRPRHDELRINFSSSSRRTWRRNSRISACSAIVSLSRSPRSISSRRTQLRNVSGDRPRRFATAVIDSPLSRCSRTASSLSSGDHFDGRPIVVSRRRELSAV